MRRSQRFVLAGFAAATFFTAVGCEPAKEVRPGFAPQTSRLGINEAGDTLYVALADHDEVRAVDAATGETRRSVAVPGSPHRLTVMKNGNVAVTARTAGTVSILDMNAGEVVSTVEVGSDPFGVVEVGDALVVAVAGEGDLAVVKGGAVDHRIALSSNADDDTDPRGLAVTDGKLVVSLFTSGELRVVDLDNEGLATDIALNLRSRRFFVPKQLDQLTLDPSAPGVVVVPHVEINNDPAQFGAGSTDFVGVPAVQYYNNGPTGFPAVVPGVSRADVDVGVALSDDANDDAQAGFVAEPTGPASPIINPLNRTLLEEEVVNAPVAVALADDGRLELVVALGSGNVIVRRSTVGEGEDSIVGVVDVGVGAEAIVLSPDGDTAYVFNGFDQSVTSFAVPETRSKDTKFAASDETDSTSNNGFGFSGRHHPIEHIGGTRVVVADQVLSAEIVRGRELFHSVDARLTQNGAISCASCHPGGGDDGTTWNFAEGPRQSPALWGGILGTEPFHWDQAVRDMADISRVTIIGRMGGSGLGPKDMNSIGAFLDQIPAPAPRSTTLNASESLSRGADLFTSLGCTECHGGADFTDGLAHAVGTGRGATTRETRDDFATPSLKGLMHTGPWLHDGSATTLRETVTRLVVTNRMVGVGKDGSTLTEAQIDDLTAYLASL